MTGPKERKCVKWMGTVDEFDALKKKLALLQDDLNRARYFIVAKAGDQFRSLLGSDGDCMTLDETFQWARALASEIIAATKPHTTALEFSGPRAMCPLCGYGSSMPHSRGLACRRDCGATLWATVG